MKNINKIKEAGSTKLYILIRYAAFVGASFVSAIFNILLFSNMAPQNDVFLVALMTSISVVLELTKVSTVITANLFHDIYNKTKIAAIKVKQNVFFTLYILLTILSIIASLGFTFTLNDRMNSTSATQLDQIERFQAKVADIQQDEFDLEDMRKELLAFDKDIKLANFSQQSSTLANAQATGAALNEAILTETAAKNKYNQFFDANTAKQKMLEAETELKKEGITEEEKSQLTNSFNSQEELFLTSLSVLGVTEANFDVQFQRAKDDKFNATAAVQNLQSHKQEAIDFDVDLTDNEKDLVELEASILIKQQEFLVDINQYIVDTSVEGEVKQLASMVEAETYLVQLSKEIKENAGVNVMFREFGKLFNMDPSMITLIILMFVSVLIELTIYQTSPDLKPTRKILYFFRNHLQQADIEDLFAKFDEEDRVWSGLPKPEPVVEEKPKPKPKPEKAIPVKKPTAKKKPVAKKKPAPKKIVTVEQVVESAQPTIPEDVVELVDEPIVEQIAEDIIEENKPALEALAETEVVEQPVEEPKVEEKEESIAHDMAQVISYRFGKATEEVMQLFCKYIEALFSDPSKSNLVDPEVAAQMTKIKPALGKQFIQRLMSITTKEKRSLVTKGDDGLYYANYTKDFILFYTTKKTKESEI